MFDKLAETIDLLIKTHQGEELACLMDNDMWEKLKTQIPTAEKQTCIAIHGVSVYYCSMPKSLKKEVILGNKSEIKRLIDILEGRSGTTFDK